METCPIIQIAKQAHCLDSSSFAIDLLPPSSQIPSSIMDAEELAVALNLLPLLTKVLTPTWMQRTGWCTQFASPLQDQETHFQHGCRGIGCYTQFAPPFMAKWPTFNMDAEGLDVALYLILPSRPRDPLADRAAFVIDLHPPSSQIPTSIMDAEELAVAYNLLSTSSQGTHFHHGCRGAVCCTSLSRPRYPLPTWMQRDQLLWLI